ncbi:hypothetical protein D3C81_2083720 [compost metagenome]
MYNHLSVLYMPFFVCLKLTELERLASDYRHVYQFLTKLLRAFLKVERLQQVFSSLL